MDDGLVTIDANWPLRKSRKRPRRWAPRRKNWFKMRLQNLMLLLCSVPHKGTYLVAGTTLIESTSLSTSWRYRWKEPDVKKKAAKGGAENVKHLAPLESNVFTALLALVEHCAVRQYDDGDPREPGWFTVKTQGAAWCIQVKDPDSAASFTALGSTLDQALETAALMLSCDEAPWEPDAWLASKRKGSRKG